MKLISNWKRILWRSWSMRLTYLGVAILWGAVLAVEIRGDIPISPFAMMILTGALIPALTVLGRIIDQGIGNG